MNRPARARVRLLDAALAVIREQGYAAMSVDSLCERAGVTKGAFFYHFESKEALAEAACEHWSAVTGALFEQASYHAPEDPLERILAYLDFRRELLRGTSAEYTCAPCPGGSRRTTARPPRAHAAMLAMKRIDIAAVQRAFRGE